MRATYKSLDGVTGEIDSPVIISQAMQHGDGFTLVCFDDWEDVHNEKPCGAVTQLSDFRIYKSELGFHVKDAN